MHKKKSKTKEVAERIQSQTDRIDMNRGLRARARRAAMKKKE